MIIHPDPFNALPVTDANWKAGSTTPLHARTRRWSRLSTAFITTGSAIAAGFMMENRLESSGLVAATLVGLSVYQALTMGHAFYQSAQQGHDLNLKQMGLYVGLQAKKIANRTLGVGLILPAMMAFLFRQGLHKIPLKTVQAVAERGDSMFDSAWETVLAREGQYQMLQIASLSPSFAQSEAFSILRDFHLIKEDAEFARRLYSGFESKEGPLLKLAHYWQLGGFSALTRDAQNPTAPSFGEQLTALLDRYEAQTSGAITHDAGIVALRNAIAISHNVSLEKSALEKALDEAQTQFSIHKNDRFKVPTKQTPRL